MLLFDSARLFITVGAIAGFLGCGGLVSSDPIDDGTDVAVAEFPAPRCDSPARLDRAKAGAIANTWIVALHAPADFDAEVDAIAARHGLVVARRLWIANAFVVEADEQTLAALRCEPAVRSVTQDRRMQATSRQVAS